MVLSSRPNLNNTGSNSASILKLEQLFTPDIVLVHSAVFFTHEREKRGKKWEREWRGAEDRREKGERVTQDREGGDREGGR